ncbi:MAG: YigZ family protein [Clostridia bacterium]|nr:YigZ family protein [Clostridia bacterium]
MTNAYITVAGSSREEIIINKSRFIGYAAPCASETDALSFLQKIKDEHKTATHHCYAYIIGENSGIMRYSDDGEPGGTAGLPIMDVVRTRNIVNCCVVVVRYFGGTLLGTGGLVRAYSQSAQSALDAAGIVRMELTSLLSCTLPYPAWDKFRYAAEQLQVMIRNVEYSHVVSFRLAVRSCDRETLIPRLEDSSDRLLTVLSEEESFEAWKTE